MRSAVSSLLGGAVFVGALCRAAPARTQSRGSQGMFQTQASRVAKALRVRVQAQRLYVEAKANDPDGNFSALKHDAVTAVRDHHEAMGKPITDEEAKEIVHLHYSYETAVRQVAKAFMKKAPEPDPKLTKLTNEAAKLAMRHYPHLAGLRHNPRLNEFQFYAIEVQRQLRFDVQGHVDRLGGIRKDDGPAFTTPGYIDNPVTTSVPSNQGFFTVQRGLFQPRYRKHSRGSQD